MQCLLKPGITILLCIAAVSCATTENYAPVIDVNAYEAVIKAGAAKPYSEKISKALNGQSKWRWPVVGSLLLPYSAKNKGIDISGRFGEPIYAASSGKVVYAGGGLRGYGQLIIIRHNDQYLSAYAYNSRIHVHDGEWVKKGQYIANMGNSASGAPSLHFEIRRNGNPVNPLNLLSY
jgi:lipoprotein NlpD